MTRVGRLDELPDGGLTRVEVDGAVVVLARLGAAVYALDDTSGHQGGPLGDGKLRGVRLACPWHGWMYDVRTGECLFPGRGARVATHPVHVAAGEVWVER